MFWSELIPSILFLGLLFIVPKSPRWLVLNGQTEEASKVLQKIHGEEMAKAAAQMESINSLYKAQLDSAGRQAEINQESIENATKLI